MALMTPVAVPSKIAGITGRPCARAAATVVASVVVELVATIEPSAAVPYHIGDTSLYSNAADEFSMVARPLVEFQ